nr:hypothetical protein [Acetivibrio clariflavus]
MQMKQWYSRSKRTREGGTVEELYVACTGTSGEAKQSDNTLWNYQPEQKTYTSEEFLKEFSGYLHADG